MGGKQQSEEPIIDTSKPYAAVDGWLVFPAIYTVMTLLGALIMLLFVNPTSLSGADLNIYWMDVIFVPIIPVIYFFWWKRKKILPHLMIIFFFLIVARQLVYWYDGASFSLFDIGFSIIWILYFIISKRVKQTFIH